MLYNTFENVIEMVRDEARRSTNTSRGTDHLEYIKRLIRRRYETLAEEWDWRHLELRGTDADVEILAGSRYYNFPTVVNTNKIDRVSTWWGNEWVPLHPAISNDDYSIHNSEEDVRADPIEKWDYKDHLQFEIWPLPASAGVVRFEGQRKLAPLVEKADRLYLDDQMVALFVAAEILAGTDRKTDAATKAGEANKRLLLCKGFKGDQQRHVFGMGGRTGNGASRSPRLYPRGPRYIRSAS